jgi:quercetin dioxygenase-like cupin family protein
MTLALMAGIALGQLGNQVLNAQNAGPTRTDLIRTHLVGIEGKEAIMLTVEGGPGLVGGKHYHPGEEFAYVLEGSLILEVEGKPPVTYQAGDTFHISPGVVHSGKNASSTAPYKVLVFGVFEKGKPDTTFLQ